MFRSRRGPHARRGSATRFLAWGLAALALAFVARAVPVRDRCVDPHAEGAPARVSVSREEGGACRLAREGGDEVLPPAACAALVCEPGLTSSLRHARLDAIFALLVAYFAGTIAWAARWRALLRLAGVRMTLGEAWRISLEAQAGGVVLPGGFGGDALRVASVVRRGASVPVAAATVLVDRAIGLATMASIAAAIAVVSSGDGALGVTTAVLAAFPLAFAAGIMVLRAVHARLARSGALEGRVGGLVGRFVVPPLAYVADPRAPRALAEAAMISVLVSAVQLGVVRGLVAALGGAPSPERWVYLGTTLSFLASLLPTVPGGWGTSDAAFVVFLGRAGLASAIALAVSLLYRLFWYASGAVGAILVFARHARAPAGAPESPAAPP